MMMMFGPHELPLQLRVQILLLLDFLFHLFRRRRRSIVVLTTTTTTHLFLFVVFEQQRKHTARSSVNNNTVNDGKENVVSLFSNKTLNIRRRINPIILHLCVGDFWEIFFGKKNRLLFSTKKKSERERELLCFDGYIIKHFGVLLGECRGEVFLIPIIHARRRPL